MGDIACLIFSKDRACQLDLLLRSVHRFAPGLYGEVTVLWTASGKEFEAAYGHVFVEHAHVRMVRERDFEGQVRRWLDLQNGPISFLVDDDVFYRDASAPERLPWSFRGGDYEYPLSVDGNVYRAWEIEGVLDGVHGWVNPTMLEATMSVLRERVSFESVHACEPPCLAGVPWNRVSASSGMPFEGPTTTELNERYLHLGRRLDVAEIAAQLAWQQPAAHMQAEPAWC